MARKEDLNSKPSLARTLGLRDLILLTIGTVIGSGIFIVPGAVLRQVSGSIALAMLVWIVGGVLSLLGALTYGEMSARNPKAGGLYVFIRDCFGPLPAFLYGWALFFVISSGSVATLAVAFSAYLGQIVPLTPTLAKVSAIAMIVLVTIVNVLGTRESANLQNWATAIKVAAILAMSAVLLWLGHGFTGAGASLWPANADAAALASGFGLAMIGVLLFIAAAAALVVNTIVTQPGRAAIGLGIVLIGAPAYFIWRSRDKGA